MFIPPLRVAMSGGGMKGLAHIGALEVLQEKGYLSGVKELIGISAGALCAFSLCIGCSVAELKMLVTVLDFGLMRTLEPESVFRFTETFGFDTGENLEKLVAAILRAKGFSPTTTFQDLAARATAQGLPALRIFATDLNACAAKEFSAARTPTFSVAQALRASMAIPIYFTPTKDPVSGNLLVDGGVVNHFPFQLLTDDERRTTLGIAFSDKHKLRSEEITSLSSFVAQIYYSLYYHQMRAVEALWGDHIVFLPCGEFPSVNFEATPEEKVRLMEAGRKGMITYLDSYKGRRPPRRFSVG